MKLQYIAIAAIAAACAISGCASVHKAGQDADARAKMFAPVADKAVVYIYRNEIMGAAIKLPVLVDGVAVGDTGPRSFLEVALPDGAHVITSKGEKDSTLSLNTTAGQVYYVWQEVKMGMWAASSMLHHVDATKGKAGVNESKLLETEAPAFRVSGDAIVKPTAPAEAAQPAHAAAPAAPATMVDPAPPAPPVAVANVPATEASGPAPAENGLAVLDARIGKPMFEAAQDIASAHHCDRLLRVRSVDGDNAHLFSKCNGTTTPIEILCNGAACHEGAPQG